MRTADNALHGQKQKVVSPKKRFLLSLFKESTLLGVTLFFCTLGHTAFIRAMYMLFKATGLISAKYIATSGIEPTLYFLLSSTGFVLSMFVPVILYMAVRRVPIEEVIPVKKVRFDILLSVFFIGSALVLLCNVPSNFFGGIFGSWFTGSVNSLAFASLEETAVGLLPIPTPILTVIETVLLPALFEEFVFRGLLLGRLQKYGNLLSIIVSALVFGVFHASFSQMLFAFLVGLVLGYIRVRFGNIWITVAIHAFNNFYASFDKIFGGICGGATGVYSGILYYVIIVLGGLTLLYLALKFRKRIVTYHYVAARKEVVLPINLLITVFSPGMVLLIGFNIIQTLGVI